MPVFSNNSTWSSWAKQLAKVLVSGSLIYYCFTLISVEEVVLVLRKVDISLLLLSFFLTILGTVLFKSLVVWRLLSGIFSMKYVAIARINFAMRFYSVVLPRPIVAGIRWNKYRVISNPKTSLVLISFEAILALAVAAIATFFFIYVDGSAVIPNWIKWSAASAGAIFSSAIVVFFLYPENKLFLSVGACFAKFRLLRPISQIIEKWRDAVGLIAFSRKSTLAPVLLFACLGHVFFLFGGYALFVAMGELIDFSTFAWIRSAVFLLVSVPISLAGIGVREIGFVSLFGLYGLDADSAIAYALLALSIQVGIGFLGLLTELNRWLIGTEPEITS